MLTFASGLHTGFRFVFTRHNFATVAQADESEGGRDKRRAMISDSGYVPQTWASGDAFSLLTPGSKLAQY
jgi:hypothetical protein